MPFFINMNELYTIVHMKQAEKQKVISLRQLGYSVKEIANLVPVSKSTVSVWVQNMVLSKKAKVRLSKRHTHGQLRSQEVLREHRLLREADIARRANEYLSKVNIPEEINLLLLSLLFWCEGTKDGGVIFTNSDPSTIRVFMELFRDCLPIDVDRIRITVHLHDYHNVEKQLLYWSKVTRIPLSQFSKPYIKPSVHKYTKENYPGCVQVRYYSNATAGLLRGIAKGYVENYGGISSMAKLRLSKS